MKRWIQSGWRRVSAAVLLSLLTVAGLRVSSCVAHAEPASRFVHYYQALGERAGDRLGLWERVLFSWALAAKAASKPGAGSVPATSS